MRLRSIQVKIALLAGVCVAVASSALVGFSIASAEDNKVYVGEHLAAASMAATSILTIPIIASMTRRAFARSGSPR